MAHIDKVRTASGDVIRPVEWSSTPYWSTVEVDDGPVETLAAYSYGIGGDVPGSVGPRKATKRDTNLKGDGGVIQEQNELLLYTIQAEVTMTTDLAGSADYFANEEFQPDFPFVSGPNMKRLQRDVMLELRIASTKAYIEQPLGFFSAALGQDISTGATDRTNTAAGTGYIVGQNGSPQTYDNRQFATPHHVAAGEAFAINLKFPFGEVRNLNFGDDDNARARVRIYAGGYRRRPVT